MYIYLSVCQIFVPWSIHPKGRRIRKKGQPPPSLSSIEMFLFVSLKYFVLLENFSLIWSQLPMKGCTFDLCSALMGEVISTYTSNRRYSAHLVIFTRQGIVISYLYTIPWQKSGLKMLVTSDYYCLPTNQNDLFNQSSVGIQFRIAKSDLFCKNLTSWFFYAMNSS